MDLQMLLMACILLKALDCCCIERRNVTVAVHWGWQSLNLQVSTICLQYQFYWLLDWTLDWGCTHTEAVVLPCLETVGQNAEHVAKVRTCLAKYISCWLQNNLRSASFALCLCKNLCMCAARLAAVGHLAQSLNQDISRADSFEDTVVHTAAVAAFVVRVVLL